MVEAHRLIRASREHVFAYVAHPEHLPRYGAPLWLAADLEERRGGEPLITLRGYFAGLPAEAVVRTASRAPHSVEITQVRGTLRGFSQRFTVEAGEEGEDTLLGCRVEADPGIPMLSDEAAKHFLTQYVERMLDRLRLAAERRAPSRRTVRPAAKPVPGATTAADAGDAALDEAAGAVETLEQDRGPAEAAAGSTAPAPAAPEGRSTGMPRPVIPPRGSVPPAGRIASDAAPAEQGRRRRRRRRRGRGTPGGGAGTRSAGGGEPAAGSSPGAG